MASRRPILLFLCRFALGFGLLILPWPGWNGIYGRYFRAIGRIVFAENSGRRILRFEPAPDARPPLDTSIAIANRDQLDATGRGPVRILSLDTRGVGWVPTALLLALVLASPVSWPRRLSALPGGLLLVHGFIFFSVAAYIWNESTGLALLSLSPFWKTVAGDLEEILITQIGASFVVPALIWIVVTFRREDFSRMADARPAEGIERGH